MIEMLPGNQCNYACWYCNPIYYDGRNGWPDKDKVLAFVNDIASRNKKVHISLTGGEPTLWPKLSEFLSELPENVENQITSNGSRTIRYWSSLAPFLDGVTISVHMDRANIEHMVALGQCLKDHGVEPFFWLVFDPKHRFKIELLFEKLKQIKCSVRAKMITKVGQVYTDEEKHRIGSMKWINGNALENTKPAVAIVDGRVVDIHKDMIIPERNSFLGWSCYASSKRFYIASDGTISAGSCEVKKLGHLNTGWNIDEETVTCTHQYCWCIDDIKVEKFKP
jgi:organic radical activating enzyme